jgi:hypothetical protein
MTVIALTKHGSFERRLRAAQRALRSWEYRLVKARAIIVHADQTNAFAVVDAKTRSVVAGGSVEKPELSLSQVEDWYNAQEFLAKVASDGTRLRDMSPATMTPGQREVVERVAKLPRAEQLEVIRYLTTMLPMHRYEGE